MGHRILSFTSLARGLCAHLATLAVTISFLGACSYRTPPVITPAPTDELIAKSVFRNADNTAKNFVCAWAPLSQVGFIAELTTVHNATSLPTCNVQFFIERENLIGKLVNPSVAAKDWATVITIPIAAHVNVTNKRDRYDRKTNEVIHESDKDDPLAREYLKLRWSGMEVHDFAYEMLYGGQRIQSVRDVEVSQEDGRSFVGFTVAVSSPIFGSLNQGQFRVNFLEFEREEDRGFEPRRYDDANSRHFGTIWGMGKDVEGVHPVQYAARWDLRPEKLPYQICLNGFEANPRAKAIALDAIAEWNALLVNAGVVPRGKKAFVPSARTSRFPLDLRCPSITYVADRRISEHSPLGIAMAQADARNGRILWGGMVIYGGALEQYVNHYRGSTKLAMSPAPRDMVFHERFGQGVYGGSPIGLMGLGNSRSSTIAFPYDENFTSENSQARLRQGIPAALSDTMRRFRDLLEAEGINRNNLQNFLGSGEVDRVFQLAQEGKGMDRLRSSLLESANERWARELGFASRAGLAQLQFNVANLLAQARGLPSLANLTDRDAQQTIEDFALRSMHETKRELQADQARMRNYLAGETWQKLMLGSETYLDTAVMSEAVFGPNWRQMSPEEKEAVLLDRRQGFRKRVYQTNMFDLDNTIADFVSELALAKVEEMPSVEEIVDVSLKKTILHEFGHMMGLAHNFEENIMPKEGTVPRRYYDELREARDKPYHQNSHTIMGYPHPYQMLVKKIEEVKLGKQDELVIRYLYKNEYPVYNGTDEDFSFRQVARDGRIPDADVDLGGGYKVAYFPSCTDYTEWFGLSPYCNRWDRGFDAKTIAQGYLEDFDVNWVQRLNNLMRNASSPRAASYYLWRRSLNTFGRLRKFYDYMRDRYADPIARIGGVERGSQRANLHLADSKNYYEFSKCNGEDQRNEHIRRVFAETNSEFADLCEVNRTVVQRLGEFLNMGGPDFTTYDNNLRVTPMIDMSAANSYQVWSRVWGTWVHLGMLPVKFSALFTLTSPMSYIGYGSYVIPNRMYSRPGANTHFIYASLYPNEFTKATSEGVLNNIQLNSEHGSDPRINRTALFMGSFLYDTFSSFESTNDFHAGFDREYLNTIRNQTNFNIGDPFVVPIFIQTVRSREANEDPDRVKSFTAILYEWGNKVTELGNAYPMPDGKVMFGYTPRTFVYPITDMLFLSDDLALIWGIRLTFDQDISGTLGPIGLKQQMYNQYTKIVDTCTKYARLGDWFSKSNPLFKGFKIIPGIAGNENRYGVFAASVLEEYRNFWDHEAYGNKDPARRDICKKAQHDVGLIVTQALAMKGFWIPQISSYVVK